MKVDFKKVFVVGYISLMITVITVVTLTNTSAKGVLIDKERVWEFNDGWRIVDYKKRLTIKLPTKVPAPPNTYVTIENTVPFNYVEGRSIAFSATLQSITVVCDGEQIYSYKYASGRTYAMLPGTQWHIVRIPERFNGMKLYITAKSEFQNLSGEFNTIYMGSKSAIIFKIIESNRILFVVSIIVLLTASALMITFLATEKKNRLQALILYVVDAHISFSVAHGRIEVTSSILRQKFYNIQNFIYIHKFLFRFGSFVH